MGGKVRIKGQEGAGEVTEIKGKKRRRWLSDGY